MERTLILIKPDGVARGLVGQILARIEAKGYRIHALSLRTATADELSAHYAEHEGKPFYQPLVDFMSEGPIVSIIASGQESSPASAHWQGRQIPRQQPRVRFAAISVATGERRFRRTWCTDPTPSSPPNARSESGSPPDSPQGSSSAHINTGALSQFLSKRDLRQGARAVCRTACCAVPSDCAVPVRTGSRRNSRTGRRRKLR